MEEGVDFLLLAGGVSLGVFPVVSWRAMGLLENVLLGIL